MQKKIKVRRNSIIANINPNGEVILGEKPNTVNVEEAEVEKQLVFQADQSANVYREVLLSDLIYVGKSFNPASSTLRDTYHVIVKVSNFDGSGSYDVRLLEIYPFLNNITLAHVTHTTYDASYDVVENYATSYRLEPVYFGASVALDVSLQMSTTPEYVSFDIYFIVN